MERAGDERVSWGNPEYGPENAVITHCRVKSRRRTLRIVYWGERNFAPLLMGSPDIFLRPECTIIKDEKKIRVGHVTLTTEGRTERLYVKEHNCLSFGHRLGSLFSASAAMRSVTGATILLERDHATARPIAAVEYREWGLLCKSLYFSEEITGTKTVESYWREDLDPLKGVTGHRKRRAFLKSLGRKLNALHGQKIYHNDLKASNLLVRCSGDLPGDPFSLIDVQGLRKCFYVSERRRIKNLAQLNRTLGPFLTHTNKLVLLKAYAESRSFNRAKERKLIKKILEETTRQIIREKSGLTGKHVFRIHLNIERSHGSSSH